MKEQDRRAQQCPPASFCRCERLANGTPVYVEESCRFGQDALLLAHFARLRRGEAACDLGTGCGVIPLRWHDRGHRGPCWAVELQPRALALLRRAVAETPAAGHIVPVCADLRTWRAPVPLDVAACNPPYFTGGLRSPDAARALARHEEACTLADVCRAGARSLRDGGRLCLCQRPQRLTDLLCALRGAGIEPKRLRFVAAKAEKAPFLVLVEGQKARAPGLCVLPTLITQTAAGAPSAEMLEIYGQESGT